MAELRKGFTFLELVVATMIFSFIMTSMSVIYQTINRHTLQNYRQDQKKIDTVLAMRTMQKRLQEATKIDVPANGAVGDELSFAVNIDQLTGCYPISTADPVTIHKFCRSNGRLYYYTGSPPPGGNGCPSGNQRFWNAAGSAFAYPACGAGSGAVGAVNFTAIRLLDNVVSSSYWPSPLPQPPVIDPIFSRALPQNGSVQVNLRILWDPGILNDASKDLSPSQRRIDYLLRTSVKVICPAI